ncbi:uncharacterized protein LOC131954415 isoform X2 [Physella acuta]|uniref:uncharacterized protein LOC131954415 isoform X2 n=1 Tax=Physella acuta TaxID=109671 RepID=UPI0027DDFA4F|nr:uncharacterized protein LOC131954415 isoform X2 [Physella acuta]
MKRITLFILTIFHYFLLNKADDEMLKLLNDPTWPWFGVNNCSKKCGSLYGPCFNQRSNRESIFERAGLLPHVKPSQEIKVVFETRDEMVDVCGKAQHMEGYKFQLNRHGRVSRILLELGAEIYRNQPSITWPVEENETYNVLLWDVGQMKIRGFWYNVHKVNETMKGFAGYMYSPPANPVRVVNPILVIVYRRQYSPTFNFLLMGCPSSASAEDCRFTVFFEMLSWKCIVGIQVYYTDGSSLYEQYRACMESTICSSQCVARYRQYAAEIKPQITFLNFNPEDINTYVNLFFFALFTRTVPYRTSACESRVVARAFEFRPRPGDNYQVDSNMKISDIYKLHYWRLNIEIAVTHYYYGVLARYYSVLVVSPDGHVTEGPHVHPAGHMFYANIRAPQNPEEYTIFKDYSDIQQLGETPVHYYILLFTHRYFLAENPFAKGCKEKCDEWDLSLLPSEFKLCGISWFLAGKDRFSAHNPQVEECPPNEEEVEAEEEFDLPWQTADYDELNLDDNNRMVDVCVAPDVEIPKTDSEFFMLK